MISRRELAYVDKPLGSVPYPGDAYAYKVMSELKEAYDLFKEKYDGKSYNIMLSDKQELQFAILNKNLCHILGIAAKNICNYGEPTAQKVLGIDYPSATSTYELLGKIIERMDDVIDNDSRDNTYKLINYYKVMIKTAIFKKMTGFNDFDFGVINFNKENHPDYVSEDTFAKSTKYIVMPSDEILIPYFLVGFLQNNGGNIYVPETAIAPEDYYKYFINQELVLPVQIPIEDEKDFTKLEATDQDKIKILQRYKTIISEYNTNSSINIFNDYESMLHEQARERKLIM